MASSTPDQLMPNDNFHRYYTSVFVNVRQEMCRVFLWLYMGGTQYAGDYLKSTPRGMKRLSVRELIILEKKEPVVKFDIPLLYKLLQHTCGLAEDNDCIWYDPLSPEDKESLEHTIFLINSESNRLRHNPEFYMHMVSNELDARLEELRRLCNLALKKAGRRACRTSQDISTSIRKMTQAFHDIRDKPPDFGYTTEKFKMVGAHEIRCRHQSIPVLSKHFVEPRLHLQRSRRRDEASFTQLLKWRCKDGEVPSVIVLLGEHGTGKTSLSHQVFESWVHGLDGVQGLREYDLVLPVQCCDITHCTLQCLLSMTLLPYTTSTCDQEEILDLMRPLKVLWLIDGYDEASVEAFRLLNSLFDGRGPSHTLLVTSHPFYILELRSILPTEENLCEAVMSGLSPAARKILTGKLITDTQFGSSTDNKSEEEFRSTLTKVSDEVDKELDNPLMLTLAIMMWKEGRLALGEGEILYHLYTAEKYSQLEKLRSELDDISHMDEMTKEERMGKWVEKLCEVAFGMINCRRLQHLDQISQIILEEECDRLQLPLETCMSTFLLCRKTENVGSENKYYSFGHVTQQAYLAAQYVYLVMSRSEDPIAALYQLFHVSSDSEELKKMDQFYMMLLYVVATVVTDQVLLEATAEALVGLLHTCDEINWFDVTHFASNSPVIARHVGKLIPEVWTVVNDKLDSAIALIKFKVPKKVIIIIHEDPEASPLRQLLTLIAAVDTKVELDINPGLYTVDKWKTSDQYLDIICHADAACTVTSFWGHLSLAGCRHLGKTTALEALVLALNKQSVLEDVLSKVQHMPRLHCLWLYLLMPNISCPPIEAAPLSVQVMTIDIPYIDKYGIDKLVATLCKISVKYHEIILGDTTSGKARKFVQRLQDSKIEVKKLTRIIYDRTADSENEYKLNYGRVPLSINLEEFALWWDNSEPFPSRD